jgi:hypothetical protein
MEQQPERVYKAKGEYMDKVISSIALHVVVVALALVLIAWLGKVVLL